MAFDLVGKAVKNLRLPTVDYNNSPIKIIPAQEGDINSRFFSVTLFDDRGDIPLTPYTKATLNATLPDGELQMAEGEIDKEKNIAICKIAGSMLSQLGKVSCDILLTGKDSTNTDMSLTSQTFYLFVAKSQAGDDAIAGSDDYTLLVQLLNEVSELEDNIETAEEARVAAEQARVTAENTRASNETKRVNAENARATAETNRASAETKRASAETARAEAETARASAEATRKTNEDARIAAETKRASAESTRATNETARKNAETARQTAEEARVAAEQARVDEYTELAGDMEEAIDNINAAAENAAKVEEIYNKMQITFFYDEEGYVCYEDKVEA